MAESSKEKAEARWREEVAAAKQREQPPTTVSGRRIDPLYHEPPETDVGESYPGQFPYLRGIHTTMYRGRLWTMRQFAGFGSAKDTNERFKFLVKQGQTGLSTAFDLPTLMGLDSDDPRSTAEVGKLGVAVDTIEDMKTLYSGIDIGKLSVSMTINAPAIIVMAFYLANAEEEGYDWQSLRGTTQNDILKEFHAQNEYIYPPEPSVRLVVDQIEFCAKQVPQWYPVSISGYHIREAGSTAAQELAFTLADGIHYVEKTLERGLAIDDFAHRLSFFFNAHNDLFEEIAKYRAGRVLWANWMRERFGAKSSNSEKLRFHAQTAGCSLQDKVPELNLVRVAYQALAAALGGCQSLHTNSMDETLALPSEHAVTLALLTQKVLAYETGVTNTVDPLGGSYFVESLTEQMACEVKDYFAQIEQLGGMLKAIEAGFFRAEIAEAAFAYQRDVDAERKIVVGVNRFQQDEAKPMELHTVSGEVEREQVARLKELKQKRDQEQVNRRRSDVSAAAANGENLMPSLIAAAKARCTVGELVNTLADVFSRFEAVL